MTTIVETPVIVGKTRFLQLATETDWANVPDSATWIDVPVTDFTVANKAKRRDGQARIGSFQGKYGALVSGNPSGNIVLPLYGWKPAGLTTSLAQFILEWCFLDQETSYPRSKSAQWMYAGHEDDKGFVGLRVDSATLTGNENGISLTAALIGQGATNGELTGTPPNTRYKLAEFLFEDTTILLAGSPINYESFTWSVQRALKPKFQNSPNLTSCAKSDWKETFSVTPLKGDNSFDVLRDGLGMPEMTGQLNLKGAHEGSITGGTNYTTLSVAFPRLSLIDSGEAGGVDLIQNPLSFAALKPDTVNNSSTMTWGTAA